MKKLFLGLLVVLSIIGSSWADEAKQVKYVFLLIGDGMSLPQRMLAEEYSKSIGGGELLLNHLPVSGFTTTHSSNSLITDSAASATALACGQKTYSGAIGVNDDKEPIESVSDVAKRQGKKVGIISNVNVNHATPAAFYAHNASRSNGYDIALNMFDKKFDFYGGAYPFHADGENSKNAKGSIYDVAKEEGYTVAGSADSIRNLDTIPALAVTSFPYTIDTDESHLSLVELTSKAIELIDNDNGFFLMVESGKIDWCGHANDIAANIHETLEFNEVVEVVYAFAQQHPEDTLIVITGDHETGGLTMGFSGTGYQSFLSRLQHQKISLGKFTSLTAEFRDDKSKTFDDVKPVITENFGLKFEGEANDPMLLSATEIAALEVAFARSRKEGTYTAAENASVLYSGYDPLTVTVGHTMANKAGVAWSTFAHTALPTATSAFGAQAEQFGGMKDNTDIANLIRPLL